MLEKQHLKLITLLITVLSVAFCAPFLSPLSQALASESKVVPVPISQIFLPKGFDSNDNVQIIIAGYLPNLCHQSIKSQFKVQNASSRSLSKKIRVKLTSNYTEPTATTGHRGCLQVAVPFIEVVDIGPLSNGTYQVHVNENTPYKASSESPLQVMVANTTSIDDHIYAKVEYVAKDDSNPQLVRIVGKNPSTCLALDQVKIISNGVNSYSLLPIMKQTSENCQKADIPFSTEVKLPDDLRSKGILLHVRSMEGHSVNTIIGSSFF